MPLLPGVLPNLKHKLFLLFFFLFLTATTLIPQNTKTVSAAPGEPPNPQPCNNPVVTDNLTDNYITDDNGDPPGPAEQGTTNNPEALKFTVTRTGTQGGLPSVAIQKQMTFSVNFSRLQALFGANNSNYAEGLFQDQNHARLNIIGLPSGKLQTFQGALQKTTPKVMTDALRANYVRYVWEKPEIAESTLEFSDYQNSAGSEKTIHELVEEFGQPQPPKAGDDKTNWNQQWGKYWEKIPTTYDEFYLGKLEFRAYLGQPTIEKLKDPATPEEAQQACSNFTLLRTVEFPVPRFFRTAQTTGILNQMLLPKVAQSNENNLIDITAGNGNVAGVKNTESILETCFEIATQNPVSKTLKKVFRVSMDKTEKQRNDLAWAFESTISKPAEEIIVNLTSLSISDLNPVKDAYAANRATNLDTDQNGCGPNGRINATLTWTHADDPSSGLPLQDQELDISLNSNFSSSVTQTFSLSRLQESRTFNDFFQPNTDYYWRVRSQYFGVWTTNDNVEFFHSITCAQPACTLNTSSTTPGGQVTVSSQNGATGRIGMLGAFGTPLAIEPAVNLPSNGSVSFTVPSSAQPGIWRVVVALSALGIFCSPDLSVEAPTPACSITAPSTLYPGDRFTVNSINGLTGEIQIKGAFWEVSRDSVNIGTLSPPSTQTLPIPNNFEPGLYAVRVGGFAVHCGDVSIGQWSLTANPINYGNVVSLQVPGGPVPHSSGGALTLEIHRATGSSAGCFPNGAGAIYTTTVNTRTVTWPPLVVEKGLFLAVIAKGTDHVSNTVCFEVRFLLTADVVGREVTFTITPPVHIQNNLSAVAVIITNTDTGQDIHDSGGLPVGTRNYPIPPSEPIKLPSGNYRACLSNLALGVWDNDQLSPPQHACIAFEISFLWPWVSAPLGDDSCIKVHTEGKAGNAPYCAIYNLKFDPPSGADQNPALRVNVIPGECNNQADQYKLNDQPNVDCDFSFSIDSNILEFDNNPSSLKMPVDSNRNNTIDENELGPWDECDPIFNQADPISCHITINVWPNFRIPFLSQAWNNTLYSDVSEVLPTLQQTGRPGFYTFAQPKVAQQLQQQPDPAIATLQSWVDSCRADPPSDPGDLSTSGCEDLANWVATEPSGWPPEYAGLPDPGQYPALAACIEDFIFSPQLTTCLTDVTQTIIDQIIKLPGQVNDAVQGVNTGSGRQVLAENTGQKERFVGGVECGKHLTRDVLLKPKVLQQHLGVEFECDLTASSDPTDPTDPNTGNPPPGDPGDPGDPGAPPNADNCNGRYSLNNPLGNFGDPNCNFSQSELYSILQNLDPSRADYWFYTIVPCESNYNPNAFNAESTSGEALGLYQMGHAAYPDIGWDYQIADPSTEYDRGDVEWRTQTSNAVNYNGLINNNFAYWGCSF